MDKTAQLGLPLVMAAQAQKHVTVNEAFTKIDALAQLRLASLVLSDPPANPNMGQNYLVAGKGAGEWAGQDGAIATYVNGGWSFTQPMLGWKAWDEQDEVWKVFDGTRWIEGAVSIKRSGAGLSVRTDEFEHTVVPGATNPTAYGLPSNSVVFGVAGRVLSSIEGSGVTSWRLGVDGSDDRYGSNLGLERNSDILGLTGTPLTYYDATPLVLSAEGGEFIFGRIRFAIHYLCFSAPGSA